MIGALLLISVGTGLFKGNLQVMVGNLYDDPKYSARRDSAFSLFYMAINIGAMFAPSAATAITNRFLGKAGLIYKADIPALAHQLLDGSITVENAGRLQDLQAVMPGDGIAAMDPSAFSAYYIEHLSSAYNMGFAVACLSLIVSIAIYFACRSWFKHADVNAKQAAATNTNVQQLTPKQTKERVTALVMVFAVVIFFWMAFHQNGQSLTWFARDYTQSFATGPVRLGFNIWILALIAAILCSVFSRASQSQESLSAESLPPLFGAEHTGSTPECPARLTSSPSYSSSSTPSMWFSSHLFQWQSSPHWQRRIKNRRHL